MLCATFNSAFILTLYALRSQFTVSWFKLVTTCLLFQSVYISARFDGMGANDIDVRLFDDYF
jgi:hypothetical protein